MLDRRAPQELSQVVDLYPKAGGVPWKLADTDPETASMKISYAARPDSDRPPFVTCGSQLFDAEGAGVELVTYDTHDMEIQWKSPSFPALKCFV